MIAFIVCATFFFTGTFGKGTGPEELLSLGLGAIDARTFISWSLPTEGAVGVLSNIFMANLPQLILSTVYYTYNGLLTCFFLSYEWDQFSRQRKGLRVSQCPQRAQRTTYFLQLPYRFAFPLLTFSAFLHWLCSQSIFLVSIAVNDAKNDGDIVKFSTCGYSPLAILGMTIMGIFMILVAFTVGNREFKSRAPAVGSCSASISAMCHVPKEESGEEAAYLPVKWGVTNFDCVTEDGEPFGHCSISSQAVQEPEEGKLYAGLQPYAKGYCGSKPRLLARSYCTLLGR